MRKANGTKLHILLIALLLLLLAVPAYAEEEPLTLTVEADPECLLSEAGDMTYFRFTVKNTLQEDYTLRQLTLQGDLIAEPKLIAEEITILANDVIEFSLENVHIEEFEFDMDLTFQLVWETIGYAPEDEAQEDPIPLEHVVTSAPFRIERFVEPILALTFAPDVLIAREGDPVTVTYTLINETKFDMTNITLQDAGIPQQIVPLERNVLTAGERIDVSATFEMGSSPVELNPTAQYTVRGVESRTTAKAPVTVECVDIDLRMEVETYTNTAEGTIFWITLRNNSSHPITDIRIVDEIGTLVAGGINLDVGSDRTISYTAPAAVSAGTVRYISFEATGYDMLGGVATAKSPSAYELLPYVESDQVKLQLTVTLKDSAQNDDGSNLLKLLFEVRNDSEVPIHDAVITESEYFRSVVNEYPILANGTTSFEKEFVVPQGTRSLSFVMSAMDPAQTQHASPTQMLDLSPLMAPKPTNPPAINPGKTVDTTGTIYDTERYSKAFRMVALIVLALTLVFLLLSVILRVAEMNIRRWLPKEAVVRPFGPRRNGPATGPAPAKAVRDPVRDQFGYMQPAKLRYMDRTDRLPTVAQEPTTGTIPVASRTVDTTRIVPIPAQGAPAPKREGDITAVPVRNRPRRPVMMSSDQTMPFAPVHEEQAAQLVRDRREDALPPKKEEAAAPKPAEPLADSQDETAVFQPAAPEPVEPETVLFERPIAREAQPEEAEAPAPEPPEPPAVQRPAPSALERERRTPAQPREIVVRPPARIVPRRKPEIVRVHAL